MAMKKQQKSSEEKIETVTSTYVSKIETMQKAAQELFSGAIDQETYENKVGFHLSADELKHLDDEIDQAGGWKNWTSNNVTEKPKTEIKIKPSETDEDFFNSLPLGN